MARIDLNCDVGESFGAYIIGDDRAVLPHVTSVNIACGAHAGDPGTMRATVRLARVHGVAIGAHPGFDDRLGFGRRDITATPDEIEDLVTYQIGALAAIARSEGSAVTHVKPHGALYNMAARNRAAADAVARGVARVDGTLVLYGLSDSSLLAAGAASGLRVAAEVFADRAYNRDGSLRARREPDAVLTDPEVVVARAVQMATRGVVAAHDGSEVTLAADTICVHGDTPGAAHLAERVKAALIAADVDVKPVAAD